MAGRIKIGELTYLLNGREIQKETYRENGKEYSEHHFPKREGSSSTIVFNDRYCVSREETMQILNETTRTINKAIYEINKKRYMEDMLILEEKEKLDSKYPP